MRSHIHHLNRLSGTERWLNQMIGEAWTDRDDERMRQMKKLRLLVKDAMVLFEKRIVAEDRGRNGQPGEDTQDVFLRRGLF